MSRVVRLHIGAPKTGTTYLQDRLALNVETLVEHGVYYPGRPLRDPSLFHFRAALDLLGQDWGGPTGHAEGAWKSMVRRVRRFRGTSIISHEILAPAPPEVVETAMADLKDLELHIVYSVRDLGRQLPAAWQESIKQGRRWSFGRFLARVEEGNAWFARAFDLPQVLNTWGRNLPPERVHVVTVPQDGGDPDLLWHRFCTALGLDPSWAPEDSERANTSLGIVETQLLRRLNRRMGRATRREAEFDSLIREMLDEDRLVDRRSGRVRLPPERYDWAEEQAGRWIDWIEGSGVDLVGDIQDLIPQRPRPTAKWRDPDDVAPRPLLRAALTALEAMTREAASRPDPDAQLAQRVRRRLGRDM